jgi:Site-specific recombinase XerD
MQFSKYFLKWFENFRTTGRAHYTVNKYIADWKYIDNHSIGRKEMKKITLNDAQTLIRDYGSKRSKATVYDFKGHVTACFKHAQAVGDVKMNPFEIVEAVFKEQKYTQQQLKEKRDEKKSLELDEYIRLKSFILNWLNLNLDKEPFAYTGLYNKQGYAMQTRVMVILMGLKTGARFSEILGITKSDIDYEKRMITIDKTWDYKKTNPDFLPTKNIASMREIFVDEELIEVIIKYVGWLEKHDVPTQKNTLFILKNRRLHNSTINHTLAAFMEVVGIEPLTFHKLRHSHISILIAEGVQLQVIAKRVGHTDTNMIQRVYGHLLVETEEKENERILKII